MTDASPPLPPTQTKVGNNRRRSYGCLFAVLFLVAIVTSVAITLWWVSRPVETTELTKQEKDILANKVEYITEANEIRILSTSESNKTLHPRMEEDDEDFIRKRVVFSERELNALLAENIDLKNTIQVTLRPDTVLAASTFELPDFVPLFGGKRVRTKAKFHIELDGQQLDIRIQKVAIGGLPLPNSWTGNLTGKNLAEELVNPGPLKAFVDGIEEFEVRDGELVFKPAK